MRTLLPFLVLLIFAACSGSPAAERIGAAEQSLETGDIDAARRAAEHVIAADDTASLSAADLCRLAMVYAAVAEDKNGNETDVAMAARCLRRALAKDSAAVDSFIHAMPVDQRPLMTLAVQLCAGAALDDIPEYEYPDSIISQP